MTFELSLETGSFDIPVILISDVNTQNFFVFCDIGYIFIGKGDVLYPSYNTGLRTNNGNEIFADLGIEKEMDRFSQV